MFDFRSFCSTRFIKEPQNDISCFLNLNIKLIFLYDIDYIVRIMNVKEYLDHATAL